MSSAYINGIVDISYHVFLLLLKEIEVVQHELQEQVQVYCFLHPLQMLLLFLLVGSDNYLHLFKLKID